MMVVQFSNVVVMIVVRYSDGGDDNGVGVVVMVVQYSRVDNLPLTPSSAGREGR